MALDTRALFMKEVDEAALKRKQKQQQEEGHGHHERQQHDEEEIQAALPQKEEEQPERADEIQFECVRCGLICGHRRVYMLEHCRHSLCLLCLYVHVSETVKNVVEKLEGAGKGDGSLPSLRSFFEFNCPQEGCLAFMSKKDIRVGAMLFEKMGLDFPALSESLMAGTLDVDLSHWGGVTIVDLKKKAMTTSLQQSFMDVPVSLSASIEGMIEEYEEFIRCPNQECLAVFERVLEDDEDRSKQVTDDKGVPLTPMALQEYYRNRFRCRRCQTVFCASCKAVPFHLGFTCAQHRGGMVMKECRFCHRSLPLEQRSYQELNVLIDMLKKLEPDQKKKKKRIDHWKIDQRLLDSLFNVEDPALTPKQKAKMMEERAKYQKVFPNLAPLNQCEKGHLLKISDYRYPADVDYDWGWFCDVCRKEGGKGEERWFCAECLPGGYDLCFTCQPSRFKCENGHAICRTMYCHGGYIDGWCCNKCKKNFSRGIERWWCRACEYDLCFACLPSRFMCASSHTLKKSTYDQGEFSQNWSCDLCKKTEPPATERWFCLPCKYNVCFTCLPSAGDGGVEIGGNVVKQIQKQVFCGQSHPLERTFYAQGPYRAGWVCNMCRKGGKSDVERWWCEKCQYDVCFSCIPSKQLAMEEEQEGDGGQGSKVEDQTVVCIELVGVYRFDLTPPDSIRMRLLVTFQADGTLALEAEEDNRLVMEIAGKPPQVSPIIMISCLKCSDMLFDVQLYAGIYRFDGAFELVHPPQPGRVSPIFVSFSGGMVRISDLKSCGTFSVSMSFEEPRVEKGFHVCTEEECASKMENSCRKFLPCGHLCLGTVDEKNCLPCLDDDCSSFGVFPAEHGSSSSDEPIQLQNVATDFCNICWTDEICSEPSLLMGCGHAFHFQCAKRQLAEDGTPGALSFKAMSCPVCTKWFSSSHPVIHERIVYFDNMKKAVDDLALRHLKLEGLDKHERVVQEGGDYFGKPLEFALHTFDFYLCENCKSPMYGGHHVCAAAGEEEGDGGAPAPPVAAADPAADGILEGQPAPPPGAPPQRRLCANCRSMGSVDGCRFHGGERTIFKCRFCCAVATYFCGGMCHYCDPCHDKAGELTDFSGWKTKDASKLPKCPGQDQCPLGIFHPANGVEYPIGCSVCRERGAMGLSSKVFFPIGVWFTHLSGHHCGAEGVHFSPLFGKGDAYEAGPKAKFKDGKYEQRGPLSCLWKGDCLRFRGGETNVVIRNFPFPVLNSNDKFGIMFSVKFGKGQEGGPVLSIAGKFEFHVTRSQITYKRRKANTTTSRAKSYSESKKKFTRIMMLMDDIEVLFATDQKYVGEASALDLPKWTSNDIIQIGKGMDSGTFSGKIKDLSLWYGQSDMAGFDYFAENMEHLIGQPVGEDIKFVYEKKSKEEEKEEEEEEVKPKEVKREVRGSSLLVKEREPPRRKRDIVSQWFKRRFRGEG